MSSKLSELAIERALETYLKKDYSQDWINQSLKTIEVRKTLTDEWDMRDNMSNAGLILNMLAEASATEISQREQPETFVANKDVARKGGKVAKAAHGTEKAGEFTARRVQSAYMSSASARFLFPLVESPVGIHFVFRVSNSSK